MSKVLVTGGAGYIGSMLVPELLRSGYEVVVVDNFMYKQTSLLDWVHSKRLAIIRGDVRDRKLMERVLSEAAIHWIIPLACIVGAPACDKDPVLATAVNYEAIRDMIDVCNRLPSSFRPRIIYPNTNSGYGTGQGTSKCDETSPVKPISLYARTKVDAETVILQYGDSVVLRLATVFGMSPRMRIDLLVNEFVYEAVTKKYVVLFEAHFKRNFIHILDVVAAFMHVMNHFEVMRRGMVYNVGLSDANLSKLELCEEIKKQIPEFVFVESAIGEDPDKRNYIVSNEKIEKTGFKPKFSIANGIAELIKGFQVVRKSGFSNV